MNYTDSDVQAIVDTQVGFKTKELQQRIDKTIEMIGLIIRDVQENNAPSKIQDLYEILSILQHEEEK